jgi:hypothetical protein
MYAAKHVDGTVVQVIVGDPAWAADRLGGDVAPVGREGRGRLAGRGRHHRPTRTGRGQRVVRGRVFPRR